MKINIKKVIKEEVKKIIDESASKDIKPQIDALNGLFVLYGTKKAGFKKAIKALLVDDMLEMDVVNDFLKSKGMATIYVSPLVSNNSTCGMSSMNSSCGSSNSGNSNNWNSCGTSSTYSSSSC